MDRAQNCWKEQPGGGSVRLHGDRLGADGGYGRGGGVTLGGMQGDISQENTRLGATLAVPLARRHSLKFSYISGLSTRLGADFDTVLLAYQLRWGGGF